MLLHPFCFPPDSIFDHPHNSLRRTFAVEAASNSGDVLPLFLALLYLMSLMPSLLLYEEAQASEFLVARGESRQIVKQEGRSSFKSVRLLPGNCPDIEDSLALSMRSTAGYGLSLRTKRTEQTR
jgi:hypothetical protein